MPLGAALRVSNSPTHAERSELCAKRARHTEGPAEEISQDGVAEDRGARKGSGKHSRSICRKGDLDGTRNFLI